MRYEETNGKKIFKKKDLIMKQIKEIKQTIKTKSTLSIYTYMNWRQFGLSISTVVGQGIFINILWFETNIKFERK